MKSKDIATLAVCVLIIGGSVFFGIKMFFPSQPKANTTTSQKATSDEASITGKINSDETKNTIDKLNTLKNYGDTNLDNIGRVNPFAPLN